MNRRTILMILGLGAALIAGAIVQRVDRNPYDLSRSTRQSRYDEAMGQTNQMVFLGDSRIEWGAWSEMLQRADISNRGIAGDTTSGILQRIRASVPNDGVVCFIQAGVNDLSKSVAVETVLTNFRSIFGYLTNERRARVIISSIILVREDMPDLNRAIAECNRGLSALVRSFGADWLELNTFLSPSGYLSAEFSEDGVHLNEKGYEQICRALAPLLPCASATS